MKNLQPANKSGKIKVNFFQRRPHAGFSFSLEYIFQDVRKRLNDKIDAKIFISKCYNNGYYTKFVNIAEAGFRQGAEVNHVTGETHFLDFLMRKKTVVLTVLDCGMMVRKKGIEKKIVRWLYLKTPISKARFVTAISEETKREIIKYTKCDPDKIQVIPVAVDDRFTPHPKPFNKEKPNILHIGTGQNKNLLRLIEALNGISCHLTIVGKLNPEYLKALAENKVDYSNEYNISNERLHQKYIECDILSFVSLFEGFGMPIVEANSVERAVITSNLSSMPEIAGNAACLVDPYKVEHIKDGIKKIIADENYRNQLIGEGKINKLRFDGNKIANMYYEIYAKVSN